MKIYIVFPGFYYIIKIKDEGLFYDKHSVDNLGFLYWCENILFSAFYTSGTDHGREGTWIWASTAQ